MHLHLLSVPEFTRAVAALPLVSIDLCVLDAKNHLLLAQRNNAPARGWWFTPGARIRKNEALSDALIRVLDEELLLPGEMAARATLMGAWDHFYPDSAFDDNLSTHYVNLPHMLRLTSTQSQTLHPPEGAGAQHAGWRWLPLGEAACETGVHRYVQVYAQWLMQHPLP